EKQIQSAGKRTFGAARPFRDGLNAAERFGAPRNNEAGIAELPFAQQDCRCALHPSNLARLARFGRQTRSGALAHWLGTPFALAFGAIICAVAGLVTLFVIRRREAQPHDERTAA